MKKTGLLILAMIMALCIAVSCAQADVVTGAVGADPGAQWGVPQINNPTYPAYPADPDPNPDWPGPDDEPSGYDEPVVDPEAEAAAAAQAADQARIGQNAAAYSQLVGMECSADDVDFTIRKIIPNLDGANAMGELKNEEDKERILSTGLAEQIYHVNGKPGKVYTSNGKNVFWFRLRGAEEHIRVRPGQSSSSSSGNRKGRLYWTSWEQDETETHHSRTLYWICGGIKYTVDEETKSCLGGTKCTPICSVCGEKVNSSAMSTDMHWYFSLD